MSDDTTTSEEWHLYDPENDGELRDSSEQFFALCDDGKVYIWYYDWCEWDAARVTHWAIPTPHRAHVGSAEETWRVACLM